MNLKDYIKKFTFPADFNAPAHFTHEDLVAKTLTRSDLQADMNAVNSSLETIRKTRGGSWPEEAVSEEFDFLDLAWHEREFRDSNSFAYAVYDDQDIYIGCFYLYPMGYRTELTEELLRYDIDASWWVTTEAYKKGHYQKLHKALQQWLLEFPISQVYYSNKEIPS
jgi:hypothetical protein